MKEVLQRYQAKFGRELGIELGDPNASEEEMVGISDVNGETLCYFCRC